MAFHEVEWYDRKPTSIVEAYDTLAKAPHAETERWTYTCPPDKIAMVELLQVSVRRFTVAAPAGQASARIHFTPSGTAIIPRILEAFIITNEVGDKDEKTIGTTMTMFEGDTISGRTLDASTGGTCSYHLSYKLTEFDAYLYHATPKTRPEPLVDVQDVGPRPDPRM